VLEELCKTTNIFGTSYSSGSCGVWSTPGMACVAASHCLGVCQLREGESVLSSAGSLCPRSRCVPEIAEPEEPRLCSDVQLCLTSVDTVDTYSVGSCPFGRCVRARTCPEVEVCQSQVDGKARVGLCPKSKRFKCVPKKRELLPRMRYEGLPQGLTSETEVVTAGAAGLNDDDLESVSEGPHNAESDTQNHMRGQVAVARSDMQEDIEARSDMQEDIEKAIGEVRSDMKEYIEKAIGEVRSDMNEYIEKAIDEVQQAMSNPLMPGKA